MNKTAPLILLAGLIWPHTCWAKEISFQGLTGASTRQAVQARFPMAKPSREMCKPGQQTSQSAEGIFSCNELKLESYNVAGVDFELTFLFLPSGTLWQVIFTHIEQNPDGTDPTYNEIMGVYRRLEDLLVSKYGQSLHYPTCAQMGDETTQTFSACAEWQGSHLATYDPSEGMIDLSADGFKHQADDKTYKFPTVSIDYHLVPSGEAGKL